MSNRFTMLCAVLFAFLIAGAANAQQTPMQVSQPDEGVDLERVGPTTRRVSPVGRSPYEHWFQENKSKMPTFEGLLIQDARTEPLEYWEDMGVDGLYIKMADYQITDGWILEIPPGGKTNKKRHLFEAGMY
ncbi:MAG: hypothetical protein OEO82_13400, partial [Gammaproteobacteria bacterium]|nr:hypothetical protein [Gammaproteobacteria bacterium]